MKIKFGKLTVYMLALFIIFPQSFLIAQQKSGDKIVFLYLNMKDGTITLEKISMRPGKLKKRRSSEEFGQISYKVFDKNEKLLIRDSISDPTIIRYEYEDPPGSGKLKKKIISF